MDRVLDIGRVRPRDPGRTVGRVARRGGLRLRRALAAGVRIEDPGVFAAVATLVLSAYFLAFPGIDLMVSGAFHDPDLGFWLSENPTLRAFRKSSSWTLGLLLAGLMVAGVAGIVARERFAAAGRSAAFLLVGLALGPGLIVNTLLKGQWGRARPIQIDAFGGEAAFTPVWRITDQCAANCSFVSGEAASAAWMTAAAVVLIPAPYRRWAVPLVAVYAALLSLNRLAFGGHFLSDILLSWTLVGLVMAVLYRVMMSCPREMRRRRRALRSEAVRIA